MEQELQCIIEIRAVPNKVLTNNYDLQIKVNGRLFVKTTVGDLERLSKRWLERLARKVKKLPFSKHLYDLRAIDKGGKDGRTNRGC